VGADYAGNALRALSVWARDGKFIYIERSFVEENVISHEIYALDPAIALGSVTEALAKCGLPRGQSPESIEPSERHGWKSRALIRITQMRVNGDRGWCQGTPSGMPKGANQVTALAAEVLGDKNFLPEGMRLI
jgi:hypothetical protein